MKDKVTKLVSTLQNLSWYATIILAIVVALIVELFIFNSYYFTFSTSDYQRYEVEVPWQEHLNRKAVVVSPEHASLTVNGFNLHISNVYVETWSPVKRKVAARLALTDNYQQYYPYPVTKFELVPGGEQSTHLIKVWDKGIAQSLVLSFDSKDIAGGIAITKLVINENPSLNFSLIRFILLCSVLSALFLTLRFKFYQFDYDPQSKLHRSLNYCCLAVVLLMSTVVFYLNNPYNTQPFGFDFHGEGVMILTDANHSMLRAMPNTEAELANSDAMVQILDSFRRGQFHLEFTPDARLAHMANPYDQSERAQYKDLYYLYDRPYYQGKQYVAFGIAPVLMIYAPIYLLTGMAPSLALAAFIGTILCVIAVHATFNVIVRSLQLRPNALIFYLAQIAGIFSLQLFSLQVYPSHYLMVYFTAIFWVAVMIMCALTIYHDQCSTMKKNLLLIAFGLGVVMVVLSRPLILLLVLAFSAPFLLGYIKAHLTQRVELLKSALCAVVPISLGAAFTMWYNYARFDSIFEFGYNYQISARDVRGEGIEFSFSILKSWFWYYIVEPLNYLKNFPFVEYPSLNNGDDGGYRYVVNRISLFAIPYYLSLLLFIRHIVANHKLAPELSIAETLVKRHNWSTGLALACAALVGYVIYIKFGIGFRYQSDLLSVLVYVAFILIALHINYSNSNKYQLMFYCMAVYVLCSSILIGFGLTFCDFEGSFSALNPDAYVAMKQIFDPFGFK